MRAIILLLASSPAFASYTFTAGEISGNLGSTYGQPLTICAHYKYANHPESNDTAVQLGSVNNADGDSILQGVTANADAFMAMSIDSALAASFAQYASGTGEYDGVWVGVCSIHTSDSSREVNVGATANTASDSAARTVPATLDEFIIGRRLSTIQAWENGIAEVCLYNGTMSDADITSYMGGTACNCLAGDENVIGYWSMDTDLSGTGSHPDESGNGGATLTEAGTLAFSADHPTITGCSGGSGSTLLRRRR